MNFILRSIVSIYLSREDIRPTREYDNEDECESGLKKLNALGRTFIPVNYG